MKGNLSLWRSLALAGLLAVGGVAPVVAAPADVALLKEYIGDWSGRGTLTGARTETVVCKMSIKQGNEDKINYSGRCALAGTNLSVNGTLAYVDANKRYEAAMTSNATFTGIAVGKKQGGGIVFNLREKDKDEEGKAITISADIALKNGKIDVAFSVVYNDTGDTLKAQVPFNR